MRHTSMTGTKLLLMICAVAALFFGAMLMMYMTFPEAEYQKSINEVKEKQHQAEEEIAKRTAEVKEELKGLRVEQKEVAAQLAELQAEKTAVDEAYAELNEKWENLDRLPELVLEHRRSYGEKIRQLEDKIAAGETDAKICYLTFDDGPNNLTAQIVEKLDEHDVFATFFTIGSNDAPNQAENLRAEMIAGHTVANHSYSHAIDWGLYMSIEELSKQIQQQDEKVYEATGFHTDIFRFPSGSVKCPFMDQAEAWLEENGYKWVDWNASAWDSGVMGLNTNSEQIAQNIRNTSKDQPITVILCHDFNYSTYDALDIIIPEFKEQGYIFLPLLPQSLMLEEPLPII